MFGEYVQWRERLLAEKEDRHRLIESMDVGLDLLVDHQGVADPLDKLRNYSLNQRDHSGTFFEPDESAVTFMREGNRLSFNSPLHTETPANNRVVCQLFETRERDASGRPGAALERDGSQLQPARATSFGEPTSQLSA